MAVLNKAIDAAPRGSPLARHGRVEDPSDLAIECSIKSAEYYIASRRIGHTLSDLTEVHAKAVILVESLKKNFPDRIGTCFKDKSPIGWNIRKAHDPLHKVWTVAYVQNHM